MKGRFVTVEVMHRDGSVSIKPAQVVREGRRYITLSNFMGDFDKRTLTRKVGHETLTIITKIT